MFQQEHFCDSKPPKVFLKEHFSRNRIMEHGYDQGDAVDLL
jgi:hypothetical protein